MRFNKYFAHQIISVSFFIATALIVKVFLESIKLIKDHIIINFLTSGLLYSIIVLISVFYFPVIFGLRKEDIRIGINKGLMYLKR